MRLPNRHLYHRIEWNVTLLTETALYIGGRKKENKERSTLNESLKTSDQSFFIIPGSSLRGVCSSFAYRVLNEVFGDCAQRTEILNDLFGCVPPERGKAAKNGRIWFADSYIPKTATTRKHITPIDRIKQIPLIPLEFESIALGQTFHMKFTIENAALVHLGIIALFLRELKQGQIAFGGNTARGFGYVKLQNIQTTVVLYNKEGEQLKTIDNVDLPIQGQYWKKQGEWLFQVWENNDLNESIQWLKQGVQALKTLSEKVIT
ncbi:RAMP superfamily CRISPR-associated protein [Geobacillus sp. YF-1]|uniref:RAMP superfamily CRISPR-associated protein n=1 Tax=Geobacillus sp. YF-1 TaxID=3457480 RepID=UPI0040453AF1